MTPRAAHLAATTSLYINPVETAVRLLARNRPVFHSERDLQYALAWTIQTLNPEARIRLESRPERGDHLDVLVGQGQSRTAIEIKYKTAAFSGTVDGEDFAVTDQSAADLSGYDCVKDIRRLERFIAAGHATTGALVLLTNHSYLWRPPTNPRPTNAAAFRVHEGTVLVGPRRWGPNTGGTKNNRPDILDLAGCYRMSWKDYASLPGRNGEFRYLLVPVPPDQPTIGELGRPPKGQVGGSQTAADASAPKPRSRCSPAWRKLAQLLDEARERRTELHCVGIAFLARRVAVRLPRGRGPRGQADAFAVCRHLPGVWA